MIAVAILFSAAGVQSWIAPTAGRIMSFYGANSGISTDPSAVATDFTAPSASKIVNSLVVFNSANSQYDFGDGIVIGEGEKIFINSKAAGTSGFYFLPDIT